MAVRRGKHGIYLFQHLYWKPPVVSFPPKSKTLEERTSYFPVCFISSQNVNTAPGVAGFTLQSGGSTCQKQQSKDMKLKQLYEPGWACLSSITLHDPRGLHPQCSLCMWSTLDHNSIGYNIYETLWNCVTPKH